MAGFFIPPPAAAQPGGILNRAPIPFWGLNKDGKCANQAPLFAADPWDTFWIGTRQLPGECTLEPGGIAELEIIKKKGKGTDGARLTLVGRDAKEFRLVVQVVTPEQWAELQDIKNTYWRIPNKTNKLAEAAVNVRHPGLDFLNIYTAVMKGVGPPVEGKLEGAMYVTFTFIEATKSGRNVTKTVDSPPPPEDPRKPASAALAPANAPPPPPESVVANLSTDGPE